MAEVAVEDTDWRDLVGEALASAIAKKGYESLTAVQLAVLDPSLVGRDLRISSQTGSGKTVAIGFTLRETAVGNASSSDKGAARPRALVVAPTRELAKQVETELSWLFAPSRVNVAGVTGGGNYRDERRALGSNPGIVVGTPGRLLDHLQRGSIDGTNLGAVVLDEADRMLDLGFRDDLEAILGFAPADHRTHLVSATFPREVTALANRIQKDPARIEGTPIGTANADIEHVVHLVQPNQRLDAIVNLLLETPEGTTLIFARTRADVGELTSLLSDIGFRVDSLSGEMEQRERNKALAAFKRGDLDALVATDVAARGIDVQDIARVLHAEPPGDVDAYTHRSGRTGRAGRQGKSSVLVTPPALNRTASLLNRARVRWRFEAVPTAASIEASREQKLFDMLTSVPAAVDPAEDEPAALPGAAAEPGDRSWDLAKRIMATGEGARALARMISRTRSNGPEAREIQQLTPPKIRGAEVRGLRPVRGDREERESYEEQPPRETREPRDDAASFTTFRVSWGQIHGADQRRLLAMVCRRGNIRGTDVGAIRVARTFATVAISNNVAEQFEQTTREPDPRDPRIKIRLEGAPEPREAPEAREIPEVREVPAARESKRGSGASSPERVSVKELSVERESRRSYKDMPVEVPPAAPSKKSVKELPAERESRQSVKEIPLERESRRSAKETPLERESRRSVKEMPAEAPPAKKSVKELPADRAEAKMVAGLPAERSAKSNTLVIHRAAKTRPDPQEDTPPALEEPAPASGFARAASRSDDLRRRLDDARKQGAPREWNNATNTRPQHGGDRPPYGSDRSPPQHGGDRSPPSYRGDRSPPQHGGDRPRPQSDERRGPPPQGDRRPPYGQRPDQRGAPSRPQGRPFQRDDRNGPPRDDRPRDDRPRPPYQGGPPGDRRPDTRPNGPPGDRRPDPRPNGPPGSSRYGAPPPRPRPGGDSPLKRKKHHP